MTLLRSVMRSPIRSVSFNPTTGKWGTLGPPLTRFTYDIDFVAGTAKGGTQPYGNNTNDGRLFRDPTNVVACFAPAASGLLVSLGASGIRRTDRGAWNYPSATVRNLWARDMTNAAWVKSASMTAAKDQVGMDGAANAASSLTAGAAAQTCLQTITLASNTNLYAAYVKRLVGTGTIEMTVDGVTFTDITAQVTASYTLRSVVQAAVTNPVIGFRIGTSGDKIAVDFNQDINPPNVGINIPNQCVVATTTATILNSQSRPNAATADLGPLGPLAQGAFAFYWQGRSERATAGFIMTSDGNMQLNVQADGSAQFSFSPGIANSNVGGWRTGLGNLNKAAGYVTAGGAVKLCLNGGNVGSGSGAVLATDLTHFDLGTNGAGQNSIYGLTERVAYGPSLTFTDAELIAMTT